MESVFRIIVLLFIIFRPSLSHAEAASSITILLFGDSIIAGYGLAPQDSLSVQLEKSFLEKGRHIKVINGGVSGDTTSGGRNRLEWSINKHSPDIVFIALGGNDVLRGFPPAVTRENLDAMLALLKKKKIPVILSAVQAPANLGVEYMGSFNRIYSDLAAQYDVPLYPFLLNDIFGDVTFMQSDGIHPTASGIQEIAKRLTPYLLEYCQKAGGGLCTQD